MRNHHAKVDLPYICSGPRARPSVRRGYLQLAVNRHFVGAQLRVKCMDRDAPLHVASYDDFPSYFSGLVAKL